MSKSTLSKLMESNHKNLIILRCKVVLVGDACCGKTALTQVFLSGGTDYPKNYMMVKNEVIIFTYGDITFSKVKYQTNYIFIYYRTHIYPDDRG